MTPVASLLSFDEACALVVAHLKERVPLAFWSVSRFDGERQIYHHVRDDAYGLVSGGSHAWSDSFCQYMVAGVAPQIAPDAQAIPLYAGAGVSKTLQIAAYVGVPIRDGDGSLFGTLCGLDPHVQDVDLLEQGPLLHLLASLLGQILHADRMRTEALDRGLTATWNALHDLLTGLPNRAMFLTEVAGRLSRDGRESSSVVLLLDLDDFTAVNDTLGYATGDRVLKQIADRLSGVVGPADVLARLSGDEFAILFADGGDPAAAAALVVRAMEEPFTVDGVRIPVSASVGVAPVAARPGAVADMDTVLAHADIAKHTAKRGPRGRFAIYHPGMTLPGAPDLQLREPLREAIRTGAIEAVYQPIVELDSGRVIAFEALARWTHEGSVIPPDVFVRVADRSGCCRTSPTT